MTSHTKKVCVVTGTRAEYGLLRGVMLGINKSKFLDLQVIATGMHLSPEFGLTVNEIKRDGFSINRNVEMLLSSDSTVGITKSMGLAMIGFADSLDELRPDLLLVLGDRYEIMAAVTAAMIARIPIAHCHGGERTEGAIDEAIRHSITKMSQLHFVATAEYRRRVIQLGEDPSTVYDVGGLGVDNIGQVKLISRRQLEKSLNFVFLKKNLLITFHPVTLDEQTSNAQMKELLSSLSDLEDTGLIFTLPNADADSRILINMVNNFCKENPCAKAFTSLGQLRYFSCINNVDGVIGNSSSGLLEVPSFKKGTINIGDRQKGRLSATSVINTPAKRNSITHALNNLYSKSFQENLKHTVNPYGNGGAVKRIIETVESWPLNNNTKKTFYDIRIE